MSSKRRLSCPKCSTSISKHSITTGSSTGAKLMILTTTLLMVVWAPLSVVVVLFLTKSMAGLLLGLAVGLLPVTVLKQLTGRPKARARCRRCGWSGLVQDLNAQRLGKERVVDIDDLAAGAGGSSGPAGIAEKVATGQGRAPVGDLGLDGVQRKQNEDAVG